MSKKNEPISETWEEITRRHEKGELIRIEDIKLDMDALGRACAHFLWAVIVEPVLDDVAKDYLTKKGRVKE